MALAAGCPLYPTPSISARMTTALVVSAGRLHTPTQHWHGLGRLANWVETRVEARSQRMREAMHSWSRSWHCSKKAQQLMLTSSQLIVANDSRSLSECLQKAPSSHPTLQSRSRVGVREWSGTKTRDIAAKGHLFSEGNPRTHIYKLVSGSVCLYRMLEDGRRQVINFAFDEDIVGLASGPLSVCNAQALAATRVKCLPISAMLTAAKADARVALGLYEALSRELVAAHEHLLSVGQRGATEKLATFLVMLSRHNESRGRSPDTISLPMTRSDIADFLGITIETVSRTLTKLRRQGLIEIDQITTLHLKSMSRLVAIAEGGARV